LIEESEEEEEGEERLQRMSSHDFKTAPIFTRDALSLLSSRSQMTPQYGVLGKALSIQFVPFCRGNARLSDSQLSDSDRVYIPEDQRLYINTVSSVHPFH
jgi:hypothetical protein